MTVSSSARPLVAAIAAILVVAVLGAAVLYAMRRRSITTVLNATVLTCAAVYTTGVLISTATALRGEQLRDLLTVMSVATALSILISVVLAKLIMIASVKLRHAVRLLDEHQEPRLPDAPTAELRGVALELAATQQRLVEARARGMAAENSRRQLLAWIGHDLRTPLSRLRAMAEGLEDELLAEPEFPEYHRAIRLQADRLAALVDDVFELSTIDAGALQPMLAPVALDDLISDTLASAQPIAHTRQLRLTGDAPRGLTVETDPRLLNRVLDNLLANALRETPAGGAVEVLAEDRPRAVWIEVRDTCGGIPKHALPHVFDPGFHAETNRPPDDRGGLGLAIARGFVTVLGGELTVRNTDTGCAFVVVLPKPQAGEAVGE